MGGITLGLAYTFGMVFPLFVMALMWDRYRLGERRFLRAKPIRFRIAGRILATNTVNVAVAAAFATMGGFVIYLAGSAQMTGGPGFQVTLGKGLERVFTLIAAGTDPVPEPVLGFAVLTLAAVFVIATLRDHRRHLPDDDDPRDEESDDHSRCHGASQAPASPRSAADLDHTDHQH